MVQRLGQWYGGEHNGTAFSTMVQRLAQWYSVHHNGTAFSTMIQRLAQLYDVKHNETDSTFSTSVYNCSSDCIFCFFYT